MRLQLFVGVKLDQGRRDRRLRACPPPPLPSTVMSSLLALVKSFDLILSSTSLYANSEAIQSPRTMANADKQKGEALGASRSSFPFHRSASSSGLPADLLEGVIMPGKLKSLKANGCSASGEGIHKDWKDADMNRRSTPSFVPEKYGVGKERSRLESEDSIGIPAPSTLEKVNFRTSQARVATSRLSAVSARVSDDFWLTVSEIILVTQPTKGPPPSRPPPLPSRVPRGKGDIFALAKEKKNCEKNYKGSLAGKPVTSAVRARVSTSLDQVRSLSMGRRSRDFEDLPNGFPREESNRNSDAVASAGTMKAAIDRVGAIRHVNESGGSEVARTSRNRGSSCLAKEEGSNDASGQVVEDKERFQKEWPRRHTRESEKKREDKEPPRILERDNDRAQQIERERQAVERVTKEARKRADAEARLKAEKASIEEAHAQNIEQEERAAVQRGLTEARQRAANEARETAAKTAAEVRRDREARVMSYEAGIGIERATVHAKGRDADDARQMATSSKAKSETSESDPDSTLKMSSQVSSVSRTWENSMEPDLSKTSASSFSRMRQAPLRATMADNLTSALGIAPSGDFKEIEGKTEERRNARMERQQKTQERAAKALAEKNHRDMQIQKEQEERYRIAETMDIEIKRWAAGKEGNLRALLSTLQFVLWPESGWQPVSLTDLINSASVRKSYRKATLCIHPDKVQQKGANLQQKYIAEKVFDLLKEAWNKLNSEVLF